MGESDMCLATVCSAVVGGLLIRSSALKITVESNDKLILRSFGGGIYFKLARGNWDNGRI
jgi:hypothetical protein